MVGKELVSLAPATGYAHAYGELWESLTQESGQLQRFGGAPVVVGGKTGPGGVFLDSKQTLNVILFMLVGVLLLVDAGAAEHPITEGEMGLLAVLIAICVWGAVRGLILRYKERRSHRVHRFVVKLGADQVIGVADIHEDPQNRTCKLILGLLPKCRGRKLGSVAGRLMIRKCFTELDAIRVESSALSTNPAALRMQDGMIQEGVLKNRFLFDGAVASADEVVFRLLRSEWQEQIAGRSKPRENARN